MKHKLMVLGLLAAALVFTSACGIVNALLGRGGGAGTVNELWSDVPKIDGLTKADLDMPLAARLMIQATTQGRINFISFTTPKTPQELIEFYTDDRMLQAGWNNPDMQGCLSDTGVNDVAALCLFGKGDPDLTELLAIVAAINEDTGQTEVFFARIDTTKDATPSN